MTERSLPVPAHPSPDELADWCADVLDAEAAAAIEAHVAGCASCTGEVAALDEVAVLLAEAGAEPVAMPVEPADSLDAALARVSLERAYGVPSLDERRAGSDPGSDASGGRRFRSAAAWMAGAAAVVVIGGLGLQSINGSGGDSDSGGATADRAESAPADADALSAGGNNAGKQNQDNGAAGSATARPSAEGPPLTANRMLVMASTLDADSLPTFASQLTSRVPGTSSYSADAMGYTWTCRMPPREAGQLRVPVVWEGTHAFVDVNREAREASVYTCGTTPSRLYSTTY